MLSVISYDFMQVYIEKIKLRISLRISNYAQS